MPALPGAHLILIHADFALASLKTRFNTGTCFDHPRQFCQRRFFERQLGPSRRREVIMVAMLGVLIGGIARGAGLEGLVVRQGTTGDHQPLLGSWAFALDPRLHPAPHYLDGHRPFLPVSHRHVGPRIDREALAPRRHRLPRGLGGTAAPLIHGPWSFQITYGGVTRDPQHIPLATLTQLVAK